MTPMPAVGRKVVIQYKSLLLLLLSSLLKLQTHCLMQWYCTGIKESARTNRRKEERDGSSTKEAPQQQSTRTCTGGRHFCNCKHEIITLAHHPHTYLPMPWMCPTKLSLWKNSLRKSAMVGVSCYYEFIWCHAAMVHTVRQQARRQVDRFSKFKSIRHKNSVVNDS